MPNNHTVKWGVIRHHQASQEGTLPTKTLILAFAILSFIATAAVAQYNTYERTPQNRTDTTNSHAGDNTR
jgi:hypothetical protein